MAVLIGQFAIFQRPPCMDNFDTFGKNLLSTSVSQNLTHYYKVGQCDLSLTNFYHF